MTKDKDFKRAVRASMAETGLTYTAARAQLVDEPSEPSVVLTDPRGLGHVPGLRRDARIFLAGHAGLVGSAIMRRLTALGFTEILTATRDQLDLRDQAAVNYWFQANRPEMVILVAGHVGGIGANSARPAEFLYDNMMIHATVVHASHVFEVEKLLYLGSSCIYPRESRQPITEDELLTGPLEPTNEGYALAKIAGVKLCEFYRQQYGCNFISAMPTNLYGPGDNFDLENAHLLPMLMHRFHEAKLLGQNQVTVWGTGTPRRELMHVDDLADACIFLLDTYDEPKHVNVGTGEDLPVGTIAEMIRDVVHPEAELVFDHTKPDGMMRKVLDVSKLRSRGWQHRIELPDGIATTYDWFLGAAQVRGWDRTPVS